ncbi:MAG: metallophosphoesterase [Longimicrobiales bacterium]|nr:metallophosphoesterase [Longimicrobiales bacterium]
MSRTLVLGDVHGAFRALEQVFERAGFDPATDRLISLGDLCDRWPEVDRCLDLMLEVDDLTLVLGNHDEWTLEWMRERMVDRWWFTVGGDGTVESYVRRADAPSPGTLKEAMRIARTVPESHVALLESAVPYHIEPDGAGGERLFTHAGWNVSRPPEEQNRHDLRMGRELWTRARLLAAGLETGDDDAGPPSSLTPFDEVYLGHTPTDWLEPRAVLEIWNLDQGAGWDGVLTLLDVETKEYWQSDRVTELYGG